MALAGAALLVLGLGLVAGGVWIARAGEGRATPAVLLDRGTSGRPADAASRAAQTLAPALALAPADGIPADTPAAEQARAIARVDTLLRDGSLRGTELDGDWGRFSGGLLQPGLPLRRRFDHLLTGLGEVDPAALRLWIAQQVAAQHGAAGAQQVLAVWDAYLALLQAPQPGAADPADAAAWQRLLAERRVQRNAALGAAWAQAFFADEDRALADFAVRRVAARDGAVLSTPTTPNSAGPDAAGPAADAQALLDAHAAPLNTAQQQARDAQRLAQFGAEASDRLQAEDAAWAAWEQRLAEARQRAVAIVADPQLSAPQRSQALEADLAQHFSGSELLRARGLLPVAR